MIRGEARGVHGIDQANHAIQSERPLALVRGQFIDDVRGVPGAAGFDEQALGLQGSEDFPQLLRELELADTAQTSSRHQTHVVIAAGGFGHANGVEPRIGEFVENHDPKFVRGLV